MDTRATSDALNDHNQAHKSSRQDVQRLYAQATWKVQGSTDEFQG